MFMQSLYALVNDEFTEVDKALVESQVVGFFTDGL